MSWLYASLSEDIMAQIVGYSTAVEIWNAFNQIYSASSMTRVTELPTKLQMPKKDGLSAGEYIQKLKSICNSLATIGELVSEKNHLIYLFSGLDHEYNPFVTSIQNQFDQPIIKQIHSLLLIYDFHLEQQNSISLHYAQVHMAYLNKKPYKSTPQPTFNHIHIQPKHSSPPFKPTTSQYQLNILGKPQPQPRQPQPQWKPHFSIQNQKPQCQICGKFGHIALICFHHTNLNYSPQPSPKYFNTVLTTNSQLSNPPEFSYPAMAHLAATHNTVPDTNWYMDSGATHHFTLDINMLDTVAPFSGSDWVIIGIGKQLCISHLGTAKLPSLYSPLVLHQVYHTPKFSNNLISVRKLCSDNKVFIEFYATHFLVKDQVSKRVILQGQLDNGLYKV